jgi:hypothetical protein
MQVWFGSVLGQEACTHLQPFLPAGIATFKSTLAMWTLVTEDCYISRKPGQWRKLHEWHCASYLSNCIVNEQQLGRKAINTGHNDWQSVDQKGAWNRTKRNAVHKKETRMSDNSTEDCGL